MVDDCIFEHLLQMFVSFVEISLVNLTLPFEHNEENHARSEKLVVRSTVNLPKHCRNIIDKPYHGQKNTERRITHKAKVNFRALKEKHRPNLLIPRSLL